MKLTPQTTILTLVKEFPFLIEALAERNPVFGKLRNPVLRNTLGRMATVERAATMGNEKPVDLLLFIAGRILTTTGEPVEIVPPENTGTPDADKPMSNEQRREGLKALIRRLHDGVNIEELQQEFTRIAGDISPGEIASLEQSLVDEGLPETEIKKLCNLHVDLFKSSLEDQEPPVMPAGHPIHTYMEENRKAGELTESLNRELGRLGDEPSETLWSFTVNQLKNLVAELSEFKTHYVRKENQLFPLLESYGLEAPAKVMWEVHDDIREHMRNSAEALKGKDHAVALKALRDLSAAVDDMIYKEERILFPMTLSTLNDQDWARIRRGDEEIGYCYGTTPGSAWSPAPLKDEAKSAAAGLIDLDTGTLTSEAINAMLCSLPVDLSMVGSDDRVCYYSDSAHRVFPRSAAVIGRDVKNCHPPKSVHTVEEILENFKSGKKDKAEFWLELNGRFIHIQYLALKNKKGDYLGCLEVSQDVTHIRSLTGQRRLLDWE